MAAVVLFTRLRPGLRAGLAVVIGAVTLTNGAMHVMHVATVRATDSDLTGVLAAASGLLLIGLGAAIPVLHRGESGVTSRRRWANRVTAAVAFTVVAQFFVIPVGVGLVQTHHSRRAVGNPPSTAFRDVTFGSADGLELAGWYHPSENRAAVVIANSAAGDRNGSRRHAALLAAHGYGVLLYDARGTGQSEGSPNGWGWDWRHDIEGALAFLQRQPDVDPDRLGGLGLSTGADVLIEVAATNRALRAVVADGATGRSFADRLPGALNAAFAWPMFTAAQVFSGAVPGKPLRHLVTRVGPTPLLLIAAGSIPGEIELNRRYAEDAGDRVELWTLPRATHITAISEEVAEYERRVIDHLDATLLRGRSGPWAGRAIS
ncbi:alpha/beta hydrolase [Nocardioides astragali]|uniref:Alpha/beta hydrolase n=1 Tax=Nocardioides astragali TaxID=1776736 RepID=A0ABW2N8C5_9ACTN|nr:CocE/NonD family hydrolase [Nocardioides astragali]